MRIRSRGRRWMRHIKYLFALVFFVGVSALADNEEKFGAESESSSEVTKRPVEESAFQTPPRTILIPVFEGGKWKGYREEPVPAERSPASESASETEMTESTGASVKTPSPTPAK